jgi:SAM-dependent methyltransferase
MPVRSAFDAGYYARFYGGAREQAHYRKEEERLGHFICAYLKYLEQPVRRVLDIGCGLGQWHGIIARHFPAADYTGVERSQHLCAKYGWTRGSAVDYRGRGRFDLVICKDTLQYLAAAEFRQAAANLARLCRGALYTSILTDRDWHEVCDPQRTDPDVYRRSGDWYRRALGRHFTNLGGGLFLSERSPAIPWDLETLPRPD